MDERERLALLIDEVYQRGMDAPEAADFLIRAGVSPSTGEDRLREAMDACHSFDNGSNRPTGWIVPDDLWQQLRAALTPTGDEQ